MSAGGIKVNMTPSHPGHFIRKEVIEELSLNVTKAARILGVRRATLSGLLNGNTALAAKTALRICVLAPHLQLSRLGRESCRGQDALGPREAPATGHRPGVPLPLGFRLFACARR